MPPRTATTTSGKPALGKSHAKATPKPPKPVEERVKGHFNSLYGQIDGGHFKNAIKTCNKILVLAPQDQDALDSKLFLLIQTERYDEALDLIKEMPGTSAEYHAFEKAYLLYRLHKEAEASEVIESARQSGNVDERALTHLEAQIKYRQTDYDAAREIYDGLLDTCPEDTEEHPDLVTNLNAAQAHLDFLSSGYLSALNALEISVATLEDAGAPPLPSTSSAAVPGASSTNAGSNLPVAVPATDPAPKPPRKSRLPKHVVLGSTPMPDPERWLKKKERTRVEGRGGRRRRKEGMGTGATQGASLPVERERVATPSASTPSASGAPKGKKGKKGR